MHTLRAVIPAPRMAPYDRACVGTDVDPIELYRWAGTIALADFDDLSTLEVAMRSAMARELANAHGIEWYRRTDLLDQETLKLIDAAWRVGRLGQPTGSLDVVHGKLVATLMFGFWVTVLGMFGFWVTVLGRGGYQGQKLHRERRIYDSLLWKPALRNAFPNVGDVDRARVETAARRVQALRNGVAHHEHIVSGVPLPGEENPDGSIVRISVSNVHETLLALAGYVDCDLEDWLRENSRLRIELARCPLTDTSRLLL